jgi:2,3-bisphosphoglycerate-independent phosphoglycerate mutase
MVGHSGLLGPAIKAIETVDACLGRLSDAVERAGGTLLITADHGNAEQMVDPSTGEPHTAHTTNPVPLILVHPPAWVDALGTGELADVAPTVLQLMGIAQPQAMTGHTLIRAKSAQAHQQRASA